MTAETALLGLRTAPVRTDSEPPTQRHNNSPQLYPKCMPFEAFAHLETLSMKYVNQQINDAPLPFILDPGQAAAVAWTLYAKLRMSVPVGGPAFADLNPAHFDRVDGILLGVLREMERVNVWRETPEAVAAWATWAGPDGGFWSKSPNN